MGVSKAMMEKVFVAKSRVTNNTIICGTRYGNVMASRGSVIPHFYDQIMSGKDITVTDPNMTRFMMTLEDAVDLVLYAFEMEILEIFSFKNHPQLLLVNWLPLVKKIYHSPVKIKILAFDTQKNP